MEINQHAAYDLYKLLEKSEKEARESCEENGEKRKCFVNLAVGEFISSALSDLAAELACPTTYNQERNYAKDALMLIGEIVAIFKEAQYFGESYFDVAAVRLMKERILFLAGGDIRMWIGVYHITRHYGGPEEGGWYYDWYGLHEAHNVSFTEIDATLTILNEEHKPEGDISSVLGDNAFEVYITVEGKRGENQTKERPHYE